ncbi:class I SAM-dependent methyltransferase [Lacisediminimonas sp.]|uniref:class I SAM-dependent methyltransferase n=1 Tax=Lacisediminimonas sp. TaxID=3060582 RepID=UPI0027190ACF|nr:class I SAM-dependent methyltransferase [Lacisediminimonas sp.]MDO8300670.1 class I SAM-dependent methyltransferase [Lacisediminimonas sp.]
MQLPPPSPEALAASNALQEEITSEIERNGGWIPFSRYMELALYAPGLGYYSGGSAKLGKEGDFTTAPEMTPLFGRTLAHVVAGLFAQCPRRLLEFGAGTGRLARDILTELRQLGIPAESYGIVELSGELRQRQQHMLRDFPEVRWLDSMPDSFSGVAIGNEVLDAMPVRLLAKQPEGWLERGVARQHERLCFSDRACPPEELALLLQQLPEPDALPFGYVAEVHPLAHGFLRALCSIVDRGAAIFVDYGFPAHEYYLGQRSAGTLMCHYRHHAHDDPFYLPGLQDITAHVDFTDAARAGLACGMDLLLYTSQASFLLDAGLPALLMQTSPEDQMRYLPMANAVQKLTSPAEMGELFKVLVLGKNVSLPPALVRGDRSHRL